MKNIVLTDRDRRFLEFLNTQGVATTEQAYKYFFFDLAQPRKRIQNLHEANIISLLSVRELFQNRKNNNVISPTFFPYITDLEINHNTRLMMLSKDYRSNKQLNSKLLKRNILIHQLMLNEVRVALENDLDFKFLLNDPKLIELSEIRIERKKEFTPDLSFESDQYKIAVELERTVKDKQRYIDRFLYLRKSPYTHMIYYYTNDSTKKFLIKRAKLNRKIGISHYKNHKEVLSPVWGYMSLNEFIEDANKLAK